MLSVGRNERRPTMSELIRSTFDGLSDGGLVRHDSRVVSVWSTKRYAVAGEATGAIVTVMEADDGDR